MGGQKTFTLFAEASPAPDCAKLYGATEAEKKSIVFRRSLYVVHDLKAGDVLTKDNVCAIRPGLGLASKYLEVVRGTALEWNLLG